MSYTKFLYDNGVDMPVSIVNNLQYETLMGSVAYGADLSAGSDIDFYGFTMLEESQQFIHRHGYVHGFTVHNFFTQYQKTHIEIDGKEYDIFMYSFPRFMTLLSKGNPNILDCLFTLKKHKTFEGEVYAHIMKSSNLFLTKTAAKKNWGFAISEWSRLIKTGQSSRSGKRPELIEKHGYDTKASYHAFRLLLQSMQMLESCRVDVYDEKRSKFLVSLRSGAYTFEKVNQMMGSSLSEFEELLAESSLPETCDMDEVNALVLECIELYYGRVY